MSVRSYCIRILACVPLVERVTVREVWKTRRGSSKIDKRMWNWCWVQETRGFQMHLMILEMWVLLGNSNIHQPRSSLYTVSSTGMWKDFRLPMSFFFIFFYSVLHLSICSLLFQSFLFHSSSFFIRVHPRCLDCFKHLVNEMFDEISTVMGLRG